MPAGFNKGQVEYIKAIANVNGHDTYKYTQFPSSAANIYNNALTTSHDNYCQWKLWTIDRIPHMRVPDTTPSNDNVLGKYTSSTIDELNCFNIPVTSDSDGTVNANYRIGAEGFLESTHLRVRCTLVHQNDDFAADHGEYRLIVFRARDKQHAEQDKMQDDNNPFYNLFRGIENYNCGFFGYEEKERIEGRTKYVDNNSATDYDRFWPSASGAFTMPINKEAWVVMKDHRFFLGREYGGKNIYETTLHWNWKDPIQTVGDYVTDTDNEKNYTWYVLLMGTNNNNNTANKATLSVKITGTTHMTSG